MQKTIGEKLLLAYTSKLLKLLVLDSRRTSDQSDGLMFFMELVKDFLNQLNQKERFDTLISLLFWKNIQILI